MPLLRREATHPLLLSLCISWRFQLAGLRGFLHPLVNSATLMLRARAGLSALLFPHLNSFPSSSSVTISHGHMLNLAIPGDCNISSPSTNQEGTLFPLPLFSDHLLYIPSKHSSSLDIPSISTTPLAPSLLLLTLPSRSSLPGSNISLTRHHSLANGLHFLTSPFLCHICWQNSNTGGTQLSATQYLNIQAHIGQVNTVRWGGNHTTRLTSCSLDSWPQNFNEKKGKKEGREEGKTKRKRKQVNSAHQT